MGHSWSQEDEGFSSQQAQAPSFIPEPEVLIPHKQPQSKTSASSSSSFNNNNYGANQERLTEVIKLPHNYEAIVRESDFPIDESSPEKLYQQLQAGVFLNGRKKKYWVEKKGNINCFMVFANGLSLAWAEDQRHWFLHDVGTREGKISVAELRNVSWLEVHGRFHTENLSPGVTYKVTYLIKLEETAYGWHVPVNFRLTLPNGSKQEHKENLKDKPLIGEWIRVPVGEFKASQENYGEIEFSLYEHEGGNWKKGLVIKGVSIVPK